MHWITTMTGCVVQLEVLNLPNTRMVFCNSTEATTILLPICNLCNWIYHSLVYLLIFFMREKKWTSLPDYVFSDIFTRVTLPPPLPFTWQVSWIFLKSLQLPPSYFVLEDTHSICFPSANTYTSSSAKVFS